ncbi:MAG: hypothetical protein Q7R39_19670 [Dehalococcoidia bacterium]|nr:hypothetical protein [Dehalococcoidia bacterium]
MGRLLGDLLIESGACTLPQLYEGLRKASEIVSRGEYRPIGEILVELGYVSIEQLEAALSIQDGETPD